MHLARYVLSATVAWLAWVAVVSAEPTVPIQPGVRQLGVWRFEHVTSVLHIQSSGPLSVIQGAAWTVHVAAIGTPVSVTCLSGCGDAVNVFHQSTIRHISSVSHIAGAVSLVSRAGVYVGMTGTALDVNCTAGCAGGASDAVNVFHQSTIRHVSSVTHVYGFVSLVNQAGTYAAFTGTALTVSVINPPDAVNVFHQSTIRHISSVTHVTGGLSLISQSGVYATFTGTSLNVNCANCTGGASDAVNVFHQSTIRHVSSVTHVAGGLSLVSQAGVYAGMTGTSLNVNVTNTVPVSGTVAATQSGEWTVRHISATVHVVGTVTANPATAMGKTITYVSVNQGAAGTTVLLAASTGNRHKILGALLSLSATGTMKFADAGADLTGPVDVSATGGFVLPTSAIPYQQTAVTSALNLVTTLGAARGVVVILTEP